MSLPLKISTILQNLEYLKQENINLTKKVDILEKHMNYEIKMLKKELLELHNLYNSNNLHNSNNS